MRDITTRTTVPVTTPLRPPRAGKGKPAEEKTAPPASSSRSDKRYVRSYGRSARRDQRAVCSPSLPARLPASSSPASVLRASQPVCRPLPARRLSNYTDRFLRKHLENKLRQTQSPALSSHAGGGPFFFSPLSFLFFWFSLFLLGSSSFFFSSFSLFSHKSTRGGAPCAPRKNRTRRV